MVRLRLEALRVYVAGAWVEQHQRARPMIARLREAGCVITCDWTKAEGDVCACGHHRQEHAPYAEGTSTWKTTTCAVQLPTGHVGDVEPCPCPLFNGIGAGGDSQLTDDARRKYTRDDLEGVLSADVVLLLAANDKGACGSWVELGAALVARRLRESGVADPYQEGRGYPYIIVAGPKNKRTIFTELADLCCSSDEEGYRAVISRQTLKAGGLVLPGWSCPSCGGFNGSAKEVLTRCSACGADSPAFKKSLQIASIPDDAEGVTVVHDVIVWGGKKMRRGKCPPDDRCLACERRGEHLEPVEGG